DLDMALPQTLFSNLKTYKVEQANDVVVRVTGSDGTVGYGSSSPRPNYHGMTQGSMLAICQYLAPQLIGMDSMELGKIHDAMDWAVYGSQPAKCAIDMALYDLNGKVLNLPVHALIGGKRRDSFSTTWTLPIGRDKIWDVEGLKAEARTRYEQG